MGGDAPVFTALLVAHDESSVETERAGNPPAHGTSLGFRWDRQLENAAEGKNANSSSGWSELLEQPGFCVLTRIWRKQVVPRLGYDETPSGVCIVGDQSLRGVLHVLRVFSLLQRK